MTEEKYKELKLPIEVKSLDEYKQCILKISDWFDDNHMRLMDSDSGYEYHEKLKELNDAKFYFFLTALEVATQSKYSKEKQLHAMYKMIFTRINNTICRRFYELDKQLETLDKDEEQK